MFPLSRNNVIIYLRKSRSDDPSLSVEDVLLKHEQQLQEYALASYGSEIPEEHIFREVVSGETITDRPVMQKVLGLLETDLVAGVLVIEPQRLSRGDLEDCGRIVNAFRYTSTLVITPTKTYDLSDEYDRKFFEMELTRGNDYLEYTKKILNRGRLASVRRGNYIGSVAPYGYRKVRIGTGKDSFYSLELEPLEANAVRLMYQLYVKDNYGFTRIAHYLDDAGIAPRKTDHWSPAAIRDMINNPVYIGKIRWNNRKTQKRLQGGEIIKTRPKFSKDCILVDGKHPAIIDEFTYHAAMDRRGKTPKIHHGAELQNPFAGLLFCGSCGRAMSRKQAVQKRKHGNSVTVSMLCDNQANCHTKSVLYHLFEERVMEVLKQTVSDFEFQLEHQDPSAERLQKAMIRNLEAELARLQERDTRQKDAYEDGIYTKTEYAVRNAKLQEQIIKTTESLRQARFTVPDTASFQEQYVRFHDCLQALQDPEVSAAEKNTLLKSCIEKIIYHNKNESRRGIGRYADNPFEIEVFLKF